MLDMAIAGRAPLALTSSGQASLDPIIQAIIGDLRLESGYIVPLRVAGAERGGLILINPRAGGDTSEVFRDLTSFSDLAAVAIDRTRLRRTRSDNATRLEVLNAVLQVTSAGLDEETLIRRAMEAMLSGSPADRVELLTLVGEDLRPRYLHGPRRGAADPDLRERRLQLHRRVVAGAAGLLENGYQGQFPAEEPYLVCVPLRAQDRILGSLLLGRHSVAYEQQELELLRAVGGHLGVGIELSRLLRRQASDAESLERALAESAAALTEAREQLAIVEEERARIQSLASLGELAAGVAHDLNNALNPVVAFAELIQEHSDQPDRVQMYADRILLAARGGAETVRRIQRFTRRRIGTPPFEPVSVSALVGEVIDLTQPSWSKRSSGGPIMVQQSVESDLLVQGNPGELRQALLNLVGNALDAMPGGGTLRFVAQGEKEEVVLAVQDTGTGMPRTVFDRALEPFFTTKGAHGTGLGLAEGFGIARRHGGSLELESKEQAGTTVFLRLPRTRTTPAPAKARRKLAGAATKLHHILLVDDSLLSLEATAASLRAAGHTVATAPNAQIALRIFNAGHYDLVLSDLGLPDMHGLELVDRLKKLDPRIRIGVITGWTIPEGEEELQRRGIDLLFVKPVDTDRLLAAL
jgi:signal transduction histidine kinase